MEVVGGKIYSTRCLWEAVRERGAVGVALLSPLRSFSPVLQHILDRGEGRHSRGEARRGDGQQGDLADLGG